jgi:thymidylate kinase
MIISLSGIDCAGKSTQLDRLESALTERGHEVRRVWFRPGYSPLMDSVRASVRRARPASLPSASAPKARARAFSRPGVSQAWVAMAIADTILNLGAHVRWLSLRGATVLCDRYVEDAMVDLTLRFPDLVATNGRLRRALVTACPTPDAAFLLQLSREEVAVRAAIKAEPFEDAPEVRSARYDAYMRLAAEGRFSVIDAAQPVEVVTRTLLDALREA